MLHVTYIKAQSVEDMKNGTFRVTLETGGRELTNEERALIERLFPNLAERAYHLLASEALLGSLATPSEIQKEPPENAGPPECVQPIQPIQPIQSGPDLSDDYVAGPDGWPEKKKSKR
jgi:hypothetical protein